MHSPDIIDNNNIQGINCTSLTMIEGYDINIYNELQRGQILTRSNYKDIILNMIRAENVLPNLET